MPELPEVETIRLSLLPHVVGTTIVGVEVRERRLRRPLAPDFERSLRNRPIGRITRRGKYLLFDIGDDEHLLVHMGMSGTLELRDAKDDQPHDHVILQLDRSAVPGSHRPAPVRLAFNDPRRFGLMRVGRLAEFDELRNVGPDPLAETWSAERLHGVTRGRRLPIKNLLMDQRVIGGIGNIYASEMLFRAGIRPRRRAANLRRRELAALADAMRVVLEEAVLAGGSSISDFRDGTGRSGYFQLRHAVYERAGQPCARCGAVIRRVVLSGRSSFYCPCCQR